MKRITSEIKKSGWFFCILYLGIIAYIVLSISEGNFKDYYSFKTIIIIFAIVILDFFNRLVKKRSEKLFQTILLLKKLRNFYDKNPWRKGFIYPGIFFISSWFVFDIANSLKNTPLEIIADIYLILGLLGSPLWVLIGYLTATKARPFTVSLITGFLIVPVFISYLMFQGFDNSAKVSATKTIHAQTVKYISAEAQKCSLGESKFVGGQSCPATAAKAVTGAVSQLKDKNPFDHVKNSVRQADSNTNDEDVGYVSLSSSGSNIIIKSCNKTPCKKEENRKQSIVSVK